MLRARASREIVADAAHLILNRPARECTGQFFIDDSVLYEAGCATLRPYSVEPGASRSATCSSTARCRRRPGVKLEFLYDEQP